MWTRFSFYFIGFTILGLILIAVFRSWVFVVFLISNLSILGIGLVYLPPKDIRIEVARKNDEIDVYEGDEIEIKFSLKNLGEDIKFLEVHDRIT